MNGITAYIFKTHSGQSTHPARLLLNQIPAIFYTASTESIFALYGTTRGVITPAAALIMILPPSHFWCRSVFIASGQWLSFTTIIKVYHHRQLIFAQNRNLRHPTPQRFLLTFCRPCSISCMGCFTQPHFHLW